MPIKKDISPISWIPMPIKITVAFTLIPKYMALMHLFIFYFEQELLDYCVSGVNILHKATLSLRHIVIEATQIEHIDFMFQSVTIAAVSMAIFKRLFLVEEYTANLMSEGGQTTLGRMVSWK